MTKIVEHLEWDTRHFRFKVARMHASSQSDVLEALRICAQDGVKLLIHGCSLEDYNHIHMLEDLVSD